MPPTPAAKALDSEVVLAEWPGRARLKVLGPDRAKLLHNLTTNDIKGRGPGSGCEAFVTSPQGKTLGLVSALVLDDEILVRTDRDGLPPILAHLGKYGVLEEVELLDATDTTFELHLAGPRAAELLAAAAGVDREALPSGDLDHMPAMLAGKPVRIARESPLGGPAGFTLIGAPDDADAVRSALESSSSPAPLRIEPEAFEALRIEAGTPRSGLDVTEKNLPQELDRDARAISFTKGCYLGQETVARLDALGHVNRLIRGLVLDAEADVIPPSGSKILAADGQKEIGWIGSSALSERSGRSIALGYVRTSHLAPDTPVLVRTPDGHDLPATVSALPIGLAPAPGP